MHESTFTTRTTSHSKPMRRKSQVRFRTSWIVNSPAELRQSSEATLSSQLSGLYLAIWRMRLPVLCSILFTQFRKGVFASHGQFNTRNNFK